MSARAHVVLSGRALEQARAAARAAGTAPPDLAVVVDVLRFTTTLVHAFAHGADAARAFVDPEEARRAREGYRPGSALLCGEIGGRRIPGFDLGNSPREYVDEFVRNRTLLCRTTNGTRALERTKEAKRQLAAAFVNAAAVVRRVSALAAEAGDREFVVWLVAAGESEAPCDEDTTCVVRLARGLAAAGFTIALEPGDEEHARRLEHADFADGEALAAFLSATPHGTLLVETDRAFARDLVDAAKLDAFDVVPEGRGGELSVAVR